MDKKIVRSLLERIDPAGLSYQEWVNVGMALHYEGLSAADWDDWSARDSARYHAGECFTKWDTFRDSGANVVTGGTIVAYAKANSGAFTIPKASYDDALTWDSIVTEDSFIDVGWVEETTLHEPGEEWNGRRELIKYLDLLFEPDEYVGYTTASYQDKDGKFKPANSGVYSKKAGQLIDELKRYEDITFAIGDYNHEAGAWIRFNPLDGKGVKNENVTSYRYALVESDTLDVAKQVALIKELELPCKAIIYSGAKSAHAIVTINATSATEYRKRVDYLYRVCEKNGLTLDKQNKNASRLSRLPGVARGGHKQYIIDTNTGKADFEDWQDWVEEINDDMGDPEAPPKAPPKLAPELIEGILREGHKLLLAGPSKAGKSFLLLQLAIAIARGKDWLGHPCRKGKVLYVNLELDARSCWVRIADILAQHDLTYAHLDDNLRVWNLRGKACPMDKLAGKLIRRAEKDRYDAVIIDPIYKVLTGDENNAADMAKFCNAFDKIALALRCAVIYCHHHSKGYQGQKRSMDRASGSGVFARDPDALLDMTELSVRPSQREEYGINPGVSVWRIEGTLREFPTFDPIDCYFEYPLHVLDTMHALQDLKPESEMSPRERGSANAKEKRMQDREKQKEQFDEVYASLATFSGDTMVSIDAIAEQIGVTKDTLRKRMGSYEDYKTIPGGKLVQKTTSVESS